MCKTCIIGYDESGFLWSASVCGLFAMPIKSEKCIQNSLFF